MGQRHGGCLWLDRDNIDGCKGSRIGWRKIIQDYKVQFGRESSRLLPSIWSYSKWLGNTTNIISPKVWDLWWTWTKVEDGCSAVRPKAKGSTMLYWLERLFVKGYILDVKKWRWLLTKLRHEQKKLLVVRTYHDMDELLAITIEVEKVLGEIGKTPYEPSYKRKGRKN